MIEKFNFSTLFINRNGNKLPSISETNSFFWTPQAKRIMVWVSGIFTMLNFVLIVGVTKRFRAKQTLKGELVVVLMISTFSSAIALGYFLFRVRKDMFLVRSGEIPNRIIPDEKPTEKICLQNMTSTEIKKEVFKSKVLDREKEFSQIQVSDFVCGHLMCYLENDWKDVPQQELQSKNSIEGCDDWKETLEKVKELCETYPDIRKLEEYEKAIDECEIKIQTNSINIERLKGEFEAFKKEVLILEECYKLQVNQQKELKIELINVHKQKIRNIIDRTAIFNEAILMAYDDRDTLPEVCLEEDVETCLENVKTLLKEKEKLMHICREKLQMNLSSAPIRIKGLSKRLSEIDVELKSHIEQREVLHKRFEETIIQLRQFIQNKEEIESFQAIITAEESNIEQLKSEIAPLEKSYSDLFHLTLEQKKKLLLDAEEFIQTQRCLSETLKRETKQLEGVQESCEKLENELNELDAMITRLKKEQQEVLLQLNSMLINSEIQQAREMIEIAKFEFKNFEQILKNEEKIEKQLIAESLTLDKQMLQLEEDLKACNTSIDKSRKDQKELLSKMSACRKNLKKIYKNNLEDHKRKNDLETQKSNLLTECGLESPITLQEFLQEPSQYIRTIDSRAINEEEIEVS